MSGLSKTLFGVVLILASLQAGAVKLKIATLTPEGSGWMESMRAGAREIKERTDGRVVIKLYGGGTMGSDKSVLRKMRAGSLHGSTFTASGLTDRFPNIQIYSLPMVFRSLDEVDFVRQRMDGKLLDGMREAGLVSFGIVHGGFAMMMSSHPVRNPDDLSGKKVWIPEGDKTSYAAMKAMGLSPVSLPLTDVMTGLQTGLVDVVTNSPVGAIVLQWHTRVKYVLRLPLVYVIGFLTIEEKAFDRLTPDDQAVVSEVMSRIYKQFDKDNRLDDAAATQALLNQGITAIDPDAGDVEGWREQVLASNLALAERGEFDAELYQEMLNYLEQYRSAKKTSTESADHADNIAHLDPGQ